jgi:PucR C-terminal helix-turn-helix domain
VRDLEVRLAAVDPDASAAVRVIGYFDRLTESGGGLEAIVRGAAVLTGCPAGLTDTERRLSLRVEPDGRSGGPAGPPDRSWPSTRFGPDGGSLLWLERPGPGGPVEAMVLERAAAAARALLARTRGRAPARSGDDQAAVEVLTDPGASPEARRHAARALGLAEGTRVRAVALAGGGTRIEPADHAVAVADADAPRTGIGTAAGLDGLPASLATARTALRLSAAGTEDDPGPRTVWYDELGGLAVLAENVGLATPMIPDELALEHAALAAPWMLATLHAVATSASLRAAAAALLVHHSTLQERIAHAERLLGWPIREPQGRHRLYLALALRRLRRHLRADD